MEEFPCVFFFDGSGVVVRIVLESALIQPVSILGGVEYTMLVPYKMNLLGVDGCSDLSNELVQAAGAHVL
jgi:hypothetical protein